jgi:choline dehydrogenase-like flavoprotein
MTAKKFDAIVVGSGAAGSFASKELTERGMEVLLLEAGPAISDKDFKEPTSDQKVKGIDVLPRFIAALQGQHIQRFFPLGQGKTAGRKASHMGPGCASHVGL